MLEFAAGLIAGFGLVFLMAWKLTGLVREYSLARQIVDVPNERSSHSVPTPRGGGVSIVVCFLAVLPVLFALGVLSWSTCLTLAVGGGVVAIIGFADDHGHVPARWRLVAHFVAAIWIVARLALDGHALALAQGVPHWLVLAFLSVGLVWLLNLYNFMDGINGIAGVEAISVSFVGGCLQLLWGFPEASLPPLMLCAAACGFLVWNFPIPRIFMGDAGSGFVGLMLGALALLASDAGSRFFWAWVVMLAVFVTDATMTLMRRLAIGDRVWEAHRAHAYQRLARRFGRHEPVTTGVLAFNCLWLAPISCLLVSDRLEVWVAVCLAYLPVLIATYLLGAGKPDNW